MYNVLVVGGAGYLGGAVVDQLLLHDNVNTTVFDSLRFEKKYLKKVDFVRGNIEDRDHLLQVINDGNFDTIIWLAALVGDPICSKFPEEAKEINEESVKWLASIAGDRRIIFPSTCSVYGSNQKLNLTEDDETNPLSVYAETKLNAEKYLQDCNALILRLGTLFGLGDCFARPRFDLVVNVMTASLVQTGELNVFGGSQMRPLVHVRDVARIMVEGVFRRRLTGVFNIAQYNARISDIAADIRRCVGSGKIITTEREQCGTDARDYSVDTSKFRSMFKMKLVHSLNGAVCEIAEAIKSGRIKDFKDPTFNNLLNPENEYEQA